MPEQVTSVIGVLVGVCNYEYDIHAMSDHMIPVNLLVCVDHNILITLLFNNPIKLGVSNVITERILCFNTPFYWSVPKLSCVKWSLLMGTSIVSPLAFPLAFINFSGSLVGYEHPREAVDLSVGVSTRPGNESSIAILVDPYALRDREFGDYHCVWPDHVVLKTKVVHGEGLQASYPEYVVFFSSETYSDEWVVCKIGPPSPWSWYSYSFNAVRSMGESQTSYIDAGILFQ